MNLGQAILNAATRAVDRVNTCRVGVLTQVDLPRLRCNVLLKGLLQGQQVELFEVPIAVQAYHGSALIVAPKVGDIVLVAFTKQDLEQQLLNRDVVPVNERHQFSINNAVVIAGLYTLADTPPAVGEDEVLLHHVSGTEYRIRQTGDIEITHHSGAGITISGDGAVTITAKSVDFREL